MKSEPPLMICTLTMILDHSKGWSILKVRVTLLPHTYYTLPANVQFIKWLKYRDYRNTSSDLSYVNVQYVDPEVFIRNIVEQSDPASSVNVTFIPTSAVTYPIANNKAPRLFTILDDDQTLVFDSFDATYESNLTGG
jgi:hypothetical protein